MNRIQKSVGAAALVAAGCLGVNYLAKASDHADTREVVNRPGSDISDVYVFPSKTDPNNVVLAMNVNPLIGAGQGLSKSFDTGVLYQFKLDMNQDGTEDKVIQVTFSGTGPTQAVTVHGPLAPVTTGTANTLLPAQPHVGQINKTFSPLPGMKVFAGAREDSFFFDLEQFFVILPDRGVPPGLTTPPANPNQPMATTWRAPGTATDFLSNGGFNVLSIVIEMPKWMLSQ